MAWKLFQLATRGRVLPLIFGLWDFGDPAQSGELLTLGL